MGFNREQCVRTSGIADCSDQIDGQVFIVGRHASDCRPKRVKFHGEVSLVYNGFAALANASGVRSHRYQPLT